MAGKGHNSVDGPKLRSFVERIERLDDEVEALNADRREVYAEARGQHFNVKAMRVLINARRRERKNPKAAQELESLVDSYRLLLEQDGTLVATRAPDKATDIARPAILSGARAAAPTDSPHAPRAGASTPCGPLPAASDAATSEAAKPEGDIAANGGDAAHPLPDATEPHDSPAATGGPVAAKLQEGPDHEHVEPQEPTGPPPPLPPSAAGPASEGPRPEHVLADTVDRGPRDADVDLLEVPAFLDRRKPKAAIAGPDVADGDDDDTDPLGF